MACCRKTRDRQEFHAKLMAAMYLSYKKVGIAFPLGVVVGSRQSGCLATRGVASIGFGADGKNDAAQSPGR
jgi:hypothetical protein